MPFNRPSPQTIRNRIAADIEAQVQNGAPLEEFAPEAILGAAFAMASHMMHEHLDWIVQQIHPDTAAAEYLERIAGFYKLTRAAATPATGMVRFTGTNGTVVPAGTQVQSSAGTRYATDADGTISGGHVDVAVTALVAGATANLATGLSVSLVTPISNVIAAALVQAPGLSGGSDAETDTALRARVIRRMQMPPHGGAEHDYIAWGLELAGVTDVYVYPNEYGLGTVGITFLMEDRTNRLPASQDVENMQELIDERRPVTADVTVFAPTALPVNITLSISPDNAANRAAVTAELQDFFTREAEPGGIIYISRLREAISTAVGEFNHTLTVPSANVDAAFGQLPVLGAITWA